MNPAQGHMDDFDDEVLEGFQQPARRDISTQSLNEAAHEVSGGRMAAVRAAGDAQRRDFMIHRGPLGATRLTLSHVPVFRALWRVWTGKRTRQEDDPGATVGEIAEELQQDVKHVRNVLMSLLRNHLIRSTVRHVGWRGSRATYYPSDAGVQALALAEVLGPGHFVQVGRNTSAWRQRNLTEPGNLFQHAALLSGGASPALDTEYP